MNAKEDIENYNKVVEESRELDYTQGKIIVVIFAIVLFYFIYRWWG